MRVSYEKRDICITFLDSTFATCLGRILLFSYLRPMTVYSTRSDLSPGKSERPPASDAPFLRLPFTGVLKRIEGLAPFAREWVITYLSFTEDSDYSLRRVYPGERR